ncbi:MAG: hypothetical protein HKN50_10280 [Gammaproteobacteria bacterium]|nr:hypothetical protein [Gammaproteobacteria bacterium]
MATYQQQYAERIQAALEQALASVTSNPRLAAAMRYATLNGGKRLRAELVYAAGRAVGADLQRLDAVAAALECIHCYSLIHDDLPAMDDDKLRRGQPTTHIEFDDATAILAGDALQTLAFSLINDPASGLEDTQCRAISLELASAAGANGMVGGQMLDIEATGQQLSLAELENMHRRKTGALISAAVRCGALCADAPEAEQLAALGVYAAKLGLAFQVIDDILDIEASTEQLGKTSGADQEAGKSTYPALLGLTESKDLAQTLYQEAVASLTMIGDNSRLMELAGFIVNRGH